MWGVIAGLAGMITTYVWYPLTCILILGLPVAGIRYMVDRVIAARVLAATKSHMRSQPEASRHRVLITGGSKGIGKELALAYAGLNADVVIVARSQVGLDAVVALAPSRITAISADLGSEQGIEAFLSSPALPDVLDTVILNHVRGFWGHWVAHPDPVVGGEGEEGAQVSQTDVWPLLSSLFAVNTMSYIALASHLLPRLAGSTWGYGPSLVVVSSAAGVVGLPKVAPYAATKHALHGFFESLGAHELPYAYPDVTLSIGVLGNIDTAANREATGGDIDHLDFLSPSATAAGIVDAVLSKHPLFFLPHASLSALHILSRILPSTIANLSFHSIYSGTAIHPHPPS